MDSEFAASWIAFGDNRRRQIVLTAEPLEPEHHWTQIFLDQEHSTEHVQIWTDGNGRPVRVEASGLGTLDELDCAIGEILTTEYGIGGSPTLYVAGELAGNDKTLELDAWYWPHGVIDVAFRAEEGIWGTFAAKDQPPTSTVVRADRKVERRGRRAR